MKLNLALLASNNYRIYNYEIAKKYGIYVAIVLADIISRYIYFMEQGMLIDNKWFYASADEIYETTALTRYQQAKAIEELEKLGFIETDLKGVPAKKHFAIGKNIHKLFFADNSSFKKTSKLVLKKLKNKNSKNFKTINSINNNINNINESDFENRSTLDEEEIYYTDPPEKTYKTKKKIYEQKGLKYKPPKMTKKQKETIKALKAINYFRDKARELHGIDFSNLNGNNAKMRKGFIMVSSEVQDIKDYVNWWLEEGGENVSFVPEVFISYAGINSYKARKAREKKDNPFLNPIKL